MIQNEVNGNLNRHLTLSVVSYTDIFLEQGGDAARQLFLVAAVGRDLGNSLS
jgi:hypothetical protein